MYFSRRNFIKNSVMLAGASILSAPTIALASTKSKMEAIEAIMTRRSVRAFTEQQVTAEQIEIIMRAAMAAPSAYNEQPWEFIIVNEKSKLESIAKIRNTAWIKSASIGILTCVDDLKIKRQKGYGVIDVSIATTNILLAVHALGLGATWTGVYPNENLVPQFKKEFNLPENITPLAFLPIGYPKTQPKQKDEYKTERIHYNNWS